MEFEDHDEQEDELGLHHHEAGYESQVLGNSSRPKTAGSPEAAGTRAATTAPPQFQLQQQQGVRSRPRYRECLKNHAVGIGGHALDGCGEFMAAGSEGTLDALKCAACGCHRNFHRKETTEPHHSDPPPIGYYRLPPSGYLHQRTPPPPLQLALPPPLQLRERGDDYQEDAAVSGGDGGGGSCRKRFRTKFTAEQKEKMLVLAERIGWRIQKQDEELVQQFCEETGVKRQVLKVWLHNNKHTLGKRQDTPDQT